MTPAPLPCARAVTAGVHDAAPIRSIANALVYAAIMLAAVVTFVLLGGEP